MSGGSKGSDGGEADDDVLKEEEEEEEEENTVQWREELRTIGFFSIVSVCLLLLLWFVTDTSALPPTLQSETVLQLQAHDYRKNLTLRSNHDAVAVAQLFSDTLNGSFALNITILERVVPKEVWNDGLVFSIVILYVCARLAALLMEKIRLPPLVGMLLVGFLLRNVPGGLVSGIPASLNSTLRNIALAIILIRAGLGLDLPKLRELAGIMCAISVVPCLVEATTVALFSMLIFGFDIKWGYLLGFVLADVSPAVTVPVLLDLQLQGYGVNKGIPTILLAGGSVNSVIAITAYGIVFSFLFAGSRAVWLTIVLGFVEIIGGVIVGIILGVVLIKLGRNLLPRLQFVGILVLALFVVFGGKQIGMAGGGVLAALAIGCTVGHLNSEGKAAQSAMFNLLWVMGGQTFLFSLLGASVTVASLEPSRVGKGVGLIFIGLVFRSIGMLCCTLPTNFNLKEKVFAALSWCPKATVQAALASVAMDYVVENYDVNSQEYQDSFDLSVTVLTLAVLSIILTAPAFALIMSYTGVRWLHQTVPEEEEEEVGEGVSLTVDGGSADGDEKIPQLPHTRARAVTWTIGGDSPSQPREIVLAPRVSMNAAGDVDFFSAAAVAVDSRVAKSSWLRPLEDSVPRRRRGATEMTGRPKLSKHALDFADSYQPAASLPETPDYSRGSFEASPRRSLPILPRQNVQAGPTMSGPALGGVVEEGGEHEGADGGRGVV